MQTKLATDIIASNDTVSMVDAAVEMNREIARLSKELDALKTALRHQGIAHVATTGLNHHTFEGTIGSAQVVAVKPSPKAKKGVDLLASENSLPSDVWTSLFTKVTKVEFAPDFEQRMASLTTAQKTVLSNLVEMVEQTPRVNLK